MSTQPSSPIGPDLRSALIAMVRKRVPESEVEDIVQTALAEAFESPHAPTEPEALRKWIFGVAKNKVVDYHRRAARESFDVPEVAGKPGPHAEADLLRWAEKNLPEGEEAQKTLHWMLREGEGEKLESIAESEHLPAPRVRQRVSRLRRHFKENWQREVALLAALGVLVSVAVFLYLKSKRPDPIANDPHAVPFDPRAEEIRKGALEKCSKALYKECVDGLDEAKRLDPAGDTRPEIQRAREDAAKTLAPAPSVTPLDTAPPPNTPPPLPSSSSDVVPEPTGWPPITKDPLGPSKDDGAKAAPPTSATPPFPAKQSPKNAKPSVNVKSAKPGPGTFGSVGDSMGDWDSKATPPPPPNSPVPTEVPSQTSPVVPKGKAGKK